MHDTASHDPVWIAGITIGIDAMLFPTADDVQILTDALLDLPGAYEVEGPWAAHAVIIVTFKDTDATAEILRTRVAITVHRCRASARQS